MFYTFSDLNSKWVTIQSSPFSKPDQGKHSGSVSMVVLNKFMVFSLTWIGDSLEIDKVDVGSHVT